MAITPKQIIGTAVDLGKGAVKLVGNLRRDDTSGPPTTPTRPVAKRTRSATSGSPATVGAPRPGEPGGVKSATAPTRARPPATKTKAPAAKPSARTKAAAKTQSAPKAQPAEPVKKAPTSK